MELIFNISIRDLEVTINNGVANFSTTRNGKSRDFFSQIYDGGSKNIKSMVLDLMVSPQCSTKIMVYIFFQI